MLPNVFMQKPRHVFIGGKASIDRSLAHWTRIEEDDIDACGIDPRDNVKVLPVDFFCDGGLVLR